MLSLTILGVTDLNRNNFKSRQSRNRGMQQATLYDSESSPLESKIFNSANCVVFAKLIKGRLAQF